MTLERWLQTGEIEDCDVRFGRALFPGDERFVEIGSLLSRSARAGHVCLTAEQAPAGFDFGGALAHLQGMAGPTRGVCPWVVDRDRVYLHRAHDREVEVATELMRRCRISTPALDRISREAIDAQFGANEVLTRMAVRMLSSRVVVLSGGPGTGKTSTVVRLLATLVEIAHRKQAHPPSVRMLAPTGKAMARLAESVRSAVQKLDVDGWVRSRIPTSAMTIHRALSLDSLGRPRFHPENPWREEYVVVDEVSMVDLELMGDVLRAVHPDSTLILIGDPDQLSSVEAGSVLADLESLTDAVFRLSVSYRYSENSGIGALAKLVLEGNARDAYEVLRDPTFTDVGICTDQRSSVIDRAAKNHRRVVSGRSPTERHERLRAHRVLCARRTGPFGVTDINRRVRGTLSSIELADAIPILVRRNDPEIELFNGDLGVIEQAEDSVVWFESYDGEFRSVPLVLVPPYEEAFALSVHQSQGSEFEAVSVVLAAGDSALATRELLYTGITRARTSVTIFGSENEFKSAVEQKTFRASGLRERLQENCAAATS